MTKPSIVIAVTATLFGATACDRNKIQREARDVEEAREQVREQEQEKAREVEKAKSELEEAKVELSLEVQKQINDLEERYLRIEKDAVSTTRRLESEGTRAQHVTEIEQARTLARTRIDEARQAKTAGEARTAIAAAEQALDAFDRKVDQHSRV